MLLREQLCGEANSFACFKKTIASKFIFETYQTRVSLCAIVTEGILIICCYRQKIRAQLCAGLLDDGTDPAYWPVLEYDPWALDPDSTEPHYVLDPQEWPLPDASLQEAAHIQPSVCIPSSISSCVTPKEPSTPEGHGDQRAARPVTDHSSPAEDDEPEGSDDCEAQGGFGGVLPDGLLERHSNGLGGNVSQEVAQEALAEPDCMSNGGAQEGHGDESSAADASPAAENGTGQEGEGMKENGAISKKPKTRKKKKVGS